MLFFSTRMSRKSFPILVQSTSRCGRSPALADRYRENATADEPHNIGLRPTRRTAPLTQNVNLPNLRKVSDAVEADLAIPLPVPVLSC
jgi:hypothetical protein